MRGFDDLVSRYVPRVFLLPIILAGAVCVVIIVPLAWLFLPLDTWDRYFE
jgi:hypothetical protein